MQEGNTLPALVKRRCFGVNTKGKNVYRWWKKGGKKEGGGPMGEKGRGGGKDLKDKPQKGVKGGGQIQQGWGNLGNRRGGKRGGRTNPEEKGQRKCSFPVPPSKGVKKNVRQIRESAMKGGRGDKGRWGGKT